MHQFVKNVNNHEQHNQEQHNTDKVEVETVPDKYGSTFSSDVHRDHTDNVSPVEVEHVISIAGAGAEAVLVRSHREIALFNM
jgi:hypothetical protein